MRPTCPKNIIENAEKNAYNTAVSAYAAGFIAGVHEGSRQVRLWAVVNDKTVSKTEILRSIRLEAEVIQKFLNEAYRGSDESAGCDQTGGGK